MAWEKTDIELEKALEKHLVGLSCQKKQMFGCPVYFIGDNMFTGVKGSMVFLRLSPPDKLDIAGDCDEIAPFEPRPGFIMREYIALPESVLSDAVFMSKWLKRSYDFSAALPPKAKKPKKTR